MGCLGRPARLSVLGIVLAFGPPAPAAAGAWTQAQGEGLAISTAGRRVAPVSSLTGGPVDSDANVSQIYLEYGLIEGLTVGAKLYVELSTSDFEASQVSLGGFLRKRVWQDGQGGVASVEAGYAHPIESLIGNGMELADPGAAPEVWLAGLYGRGWGGDWGNAFVSTGLGYQWRGDGLADEVRTEITGGYSPSRHWTGFFSLYALTPLGDGTDASLKIAPSIGYTLWPGDEDEDAEPARPSTIQLGVTYDVLKRNDGLGFFLSIWRPF